MNTLPSPAAMSISRHTCRQRLHDSGLVWGSTGAKIDHAILSCQKAWGRHGLHFAVFLKKAVAQGKTGVEQ